jgi:copper(I)-binding protein
VMRMVPQPDGWEIAPGGELVLKPGGKHVMLMGLVRPLEPGATIEITLNFDKAGPVKVQVPVKAMQ